MGVRAKGRKWRDSGLYIVSSRSHGKINPCAAAGTATRQFYNIRRHTGTDFGYNMKHLWCNGNASLLCLFIVANVFGKSLVRLQADACIFGFFVFFLLVVLGY